MHGQRLRRAVILGVRRKTVADFDVVKFSPVLPRFFQPVLCVLFGVAFKG